MNLDLLICLHQSLDDTTTPILLLILIIEGIRLYVNIITGGHFHRLPLRLPLKIVRHLEVVLLHTDGAILIYLE